MTQKPDSWPRQSSKEDRAQTMAAAVTTCKALTWERGHHFGGSLLFLFLF